ncbi:MAG TPA: hypothetical protein DCM05_04300 [Elusimicrobia bacterium]|nr:hypothetical protein [Elusimicrobiota bacterium]
MKARLLTALAAALLCGCTTSIRMSYKPGSPARPLRAERLPRIHLSPLYDKTPGFIQPGPVLKGVFRPPLVTGVLDALRTELERLGLPLVDRGQADAVLQGTIVKAWGGPSGMGTGCEIDLALRLDSPSGQPLWNDTLFGNGTSMAVASSFDDSCTRALAALMGQIGPAFESQGVLAKAVAGGAAAARAEKPAPAAAPAVRSDVDELPARSAPKKDKAYAVVIGIRKYRQGVPEADFADTDARLVSSYLTRTLGFEDANVATLINDDATKSGFEKYFESWLPNRVEEDAEVFVYFSGHGSPNPKTGDAYLVPYDGDPTYLDKTGYPLKRLYAELAKLPAKRITVAMDSCFSGAGGRSVMARGARPLVSAALDEGLPEKLAVLAAAAGDQISNTYQEKGHGLFTYFLLKGIREQAGRRDVDFKAAFDYAAPKVANTARREFNADQTPQWKGRP